MLTRLEIGPNLMEICLPLPPNAGIKDVCHQARLRLTHNAVSLNNWKPAHSAEVISQVEIKINVESGCSSFDGVLA